jgi:hypothetical protein
MGQLLRNRRLGRWRADRIAVRCYDTHCRAAGTTCGGGRRRVCHADDRSFGHRAALSALLRAPWQAIGLVAALWGLTGLGGVAYSAIVARRMRTQTVYQPEFEDWLFHFVLPLAAYAMLALSAVAAPAHTREALFGVGAATLLCFLSEFTTPGTASPTTYSGNVRVSVEPRSLSSRRRSMNGHFSRSRPTSPMTTLARGAEVICPRKKKGGPMGPPLRCLVRRRTRQCLVSIRLP